VEWHDDQFQKIVADLGHLVISEFLLHFILLTSSV